MTETRIPRRRFLQQAGSATALGLAAPAFMPASALGRTARLAPSERTAVGMLGTGRQAYLVNLGRQLLDMPDIQVIALCDVDRWRLNETRQLVAKKYGEASPSGSYEGCRTFRDYREVLARDDVDAVMISTPDHWHAPMAIAAAEAGKHVSLERPITRTIAEGQSIIAAIRKHQRVFRMDSEMRSENWLHRMADGTPLYYENTRNPQISGAQGKCLAYVKIEGSEGSIYGAYGPQQLLAEPASLLETRIGADGVHLPFKSDKQDFIDAIKSGGQTLEDEEVAHRTTSICHLGHIAIHCRKYFTGEFRTQSPRDAADWSLYRQEVLPGSFFGAQVELSSQFSDLPSVSRSCFRAPAVKFAELHPSPFEVLSFDLNGKQVAAGQNSLFCRRFVYDRFQNCIRSAERLGYLISE